MAVDVGSAVGYLDLDVSGFLSGLKSAQSEADIASKNIATKLGNNLQGAGKSLKSVGSTLTKGVTLPLAGIATAGLKVATDFETSMSKVKAISGATGDEFDTLRQKAIDLGGSTAFSATEVADAMTEMAKAGWSTDQIMTGMSGVLDAAAASGEGLGSVSTIVADAITGFGMAASDSTRVADLLTQAANSGTIGINDLGESFKYIAPVADAMGFSIEDTTTAITAMSMAGIKGSQAGTSLKNVLTNLNNPTDEMATTMGELGVTVANADGTFKSLDTIVAELRTSFAGLTDEEKAQSAATLAGKEGMSGLLALLNLTQTKYDEIALSMDNANGIAQETATIMRDNLSSDTEEFMGSLESLAITLSENLMPHLRTFVQWLTDLATKFGELDPETQKTILALGGVAIAAGPVISIVGSLTSGVGKVVTAFGNLTSKGGAAAGSIGSVGSAASGASGGVGSAAASFGNLAGQALKLVATGATLMMVGVAIKMIADSSIEVANAGPGAAATFVLLAAVGVGMAAAIAAIGGASTATAPGLLALGAAVLMVSGGVALMTGALSLVIDSISNLVTSIASASTSLPLIAEHGGSAAAALTLLAGGVVLVSGAMLTLAASTAAGLLPFVGAAATIGLVDVALAAMLVTSGLAAAGMLVLGASLEGVEAQMKAIEQSVDNSAGALEDMVTSINIVDSFINGLESTVKTVAKAFIDFFSGSEKPIESFSKKMQSASSEVTTAMSNMKTSAKKEITEIKTALDEVSATAMTMANKSTIAFTVFVASFKIKATELKNEIKSLENAFATAKFSFQQSIKLPHFKMSGSFNAQTGSVPSVGVSWYRKAMASGMILNGATIFGYDPSTRKFLGGGEAGSEAVVGTSSLMRMIRVSVNAALRDFVYTGLFNERSSASKDVVGSQYRNDVKIDITVEAKVASDYDVQNLGRTLGVSVERELRSKGVSVV